MAVNSVATDRTNVVFPFLASMRSSASLALGAASRTCDPVSSAGGKPFPSKFEDAREFSSLPQRDWGGWSLR